MIKYIIQSSLSNKIRLAITLGIRSYKTKVMKGKHPNNDVPFIPKEEILVEEILGALGDSIEDMLDIIKQGFTK